MQEKLENEIVYLELSTWRQAQTYLPVAYYQTSFLIITRLCDFLNWFIVYCAQNAVIKCDCMTP